MDVDIAKASAPNQTLGKSALGLYARLKRIHGRRWQGAIRDSSGRHPARHITSQVSAPGYLLERFADPFIVAVVPKGVSAVAHAAP
jgi:hypothetical protein